MKRRDGCGRGGLREVRKRERGSRTRLAGGRAAKRVSATSWRNFDP